MLSDLDTPAAWKQLLDRHYDRALQSGLPLFNGTSRRSTPFNAAPYMVSHEKFLFEAAGWPGRAGLLHALQGCLAQAHASGICVDGMLIGGSFVDLSNPAPRDLDCVWLYRTAVGAGQDAALLVALQKRFKADAVDVRFIPVDADPMLFAKTYGFFVLFYAVGRLDSTGESRAPLLVDLNGWPG